MRYNKRYNDLYNILDHHRQAGHILVFHDTTDLGSRNRYGRCGRAQILRAELRSEKLILQARTRTTRFVSQTVLLLCLLIGHIFAPVVG